MKIFDTMAKILGWIAVGIGITAITGYCREKNDRPVSSSDVIETYFVDENP